MHAKQKPGILLSRLLPLLLCLLLALPLAACGRSASGADSAERDTESSTSVKADEKDQKKTESEENTSNEEETTATEAEGASDDGITVIPWPDEIPKEVPELKDAGLSAAAPDSNGSNGITLMFSTSDTKLVKDYVEALTQAGFTQDSLSENKFGLDYSGKKDGILVTINYVQGNLSKLHVKQ